MLISWIGDQFILLPLVNFMIGNVSLIIGLGYWIYGMYHQHASPQSTVYFWILVTVNGALTLIAVGWCFDLCTSVWLTLAQGEVSLEEGLRRARRSQTISCEELRVELDAYIEEADGIENINLQTFKTRLRTIDPDNTTEGEQDEDLINLGLVTDRVATRIFEAKVKEVVDSRLALAKTVANGLKSNGSSAAASVPEEPDTDRLTFREPRRSVVIDRWMVDKLQAELNQNKSTRIESKSGAARALVHEYVKQYEEDRALQIRMATSQRIAQMGPIWSMMKCLGLIPWCQKMGLFPDWYDPDNKPRRGWFSYMFQTPAPMFSFENIFNTFTFKW